MGTQSALVVLSKYTYQGRLMLSVLTTSAILPPSLCAGNSATPMVYSHLEKSESFLSMHRDKSFSEN